MVYVYEQKKTLFGGYKTTVVGECENVHLAMDMMNSIVTDKIIEIGQKKFDKLQSKGKLVYFVEKDSFAFEIEG